MRRILNNNGTSLKDLVAQQRAVMTAADALVKVMGLAKPHGRDYQRSDPSYSEYTFKIDRDEWKEMMLQVVAIKSYALTTGINLTHGDTTGLQG